MLDDAEIWVMDDIWTPSELSGFPAWRPPAEFRRRLHTICALYAHERPDRRPALLDHLESLALEAAASLAVDLLESGWRPSEAETEAG